MGNEKMELGLLPSSKTINQELHQTINEINVIYQHPCFKRENDTAA